MQPVLWPDPKICTREQGEGVLKLVVAEKVSGPLANESESESCAYFRPAPCGSR